MTEMRKADLNRRSIVKGAAWSVPVVAAAVAAPLATASEVPTTCAGCFKAGKILGLPIGVGLAASVVSNQTGAFLMPGVLAIDSNGGDCQFRILTGVAFAATITQAKLTWRHGNQTLTRSSFITAGAMTGFVGTPIGGSLAVSSFTNLPFPTGLYAGSNPPAEPTRICYEVNFTIQAGVIPIPNATDISCSQDLCWDVSMTALGGVVPGLFNSGAGTVEYVGIKFTPVN